MPNMAPITDSRSTARRLAWALSLGVLSLSASSSLAAQESQRAPKQPGQVHRNGDREITFLIHRKGEKTFVDFKVKRASRAEVDKALARVEILAKDGMNYGGGKWPLNTELKADEEVLSFELEHMTLESIRKTL